MAAFGVDARGIATILGGDGLIDEALISGKVVEVGTGAQQQGVTDRGFRMTVSALDRTVLVAASRLLRVRVMPAGDADAELGHVGEVRQSHSAGFVDLPENDLGMAPPHLLENADRPKARRRAKQRHDLVVEDRHQGIGPATPTEPVALRRKAGIA